MTQIQIGNLQLCVAPSNVIVCNDVLFYSLQVYVIYSSDSSENILNVGGMVAYAWVSMHGMEARIDLIYRLAYLMSECFDAFCGNIDGDADEGGTGGGDVGVVADERYIRTLCSN